MFSGTLNWDPFYCLAGYEKESNRLYANEVNESAEHSSCWVHSTTNISRPAIQRTLRNFPVNFSASNKTIFGLIQFYPAQIPPDILQMNEIGFHCYELWVEKRCQSRHFVEFQHYYPNKWTINEGGWHIKYDIEFGVTRWRRNSSKIINFPFIVR